MSPENQGVFQLLKEETQPALDGFSKVGIFFTDAFLEGKP